MSYKHKYTLYLNNIPNSIIEDIRLLLYYIDSNIQFDIIEINNKDGESSKGIPPIGISLYCYFITIKDLKYTTCAIKPYEDGLGYGICLLNVDLDNYLKQFNHIKTFDELIEVVKTKLTDSIKFCETYIDVKF